MYQRQIEISSDHHRTTLKQTEAELRELVEALKAHSRADPTDKNRNEAIAQAMLALRHIEDASMRLGKVLQYAVQGGVPWGGCEPRPVDIDRGPIVNDAPTGRPIPG
jgi:hypothetical protein